MNEKLTLTREWDKSLFKISPRMSWRRIIRPDCVKNPCHPSGCLRIFALQGKKSTRQSIHVEILNRLLEPVFTTDERRLGGLIPAILRRCSLSDGKNPRPSGIPDYEYRF